MDFIKEKQLSFQDHQENLTGKRGLEKIYNLNPGAVTHMKTAAGKSLCIQPHCFLL